MSEEKGTFVIAGEKAQVAADYVSATASAAGAYVVEKATATKDWVVDEPTARSTAPQTRCEAPEIRSILKNEAEHPEQGAVQEVKRKQRRMK